jgi:hypothetical protein
MNPRWRAKVVKFADMWLYKLLKHFGGKAGKQLLLNDFGILFATLFFGILCSKSQKENGDHPKV